MVNTIGNRKEWLDALRAVAIILVVFGHCLQSYDTFFIYTSPIKIPLFFAITGFLINGQKSVKLFFKDWFFGIIIPYILLSLIPIIVLSPISSPNVTEQNLKSILSGETYWFLPCLIIGNVIQFYQKKLFERRLYLYVLSCILLSGFGYFLAINHIGDYGCLNLALEVQIFYMLGALLRHFDQAIQDNVPKWMAILAVLVYVTMCLLSNYIYPKESLDVHESYYYDLVVCLFTIIVGVTSLFVLFPKITTHSRMLVFIGQNTFVIYMWAGFVWTIFVSLLHLVGYEYPFNLLGDLIKSCIIIACCCMAAAVLNKYVPVIVGNTKKKY